MSATSLERTRQFLRRRPLPEAWTLCVLTERCLSVAEPPDRISHDSGQFEHISTREANGTEPKQTPGSPDAEGKNPGAPTKTRGSGFGHPNTLIGRLSRYVTVCIVPLRTHRRADGSVARPQRSLRSSRYCYLRYFRYVPPPHPGLPSGTNARDASPRTECEGRHCAPHGKAPHRHRRSGGSVASPERTLPDRLCFQYSCSMKTNVTVCGHPASRNSAEDTIAPGDARPPSLIPGAKAGAPPMSRCTRRVPATSFGGESRLARRPGLFRVPKQPIGRPHEKTTRGGRRGAPPPHRVQRRAGEHLRRPAAP